MSSHKYHEDEGYTEGKKAKRRNPMEGIRVVDAASLDPEKNRKQVKLTEAKKGTRSPNFGVDDY